MLALIWLALSTVQASDLPKEVKVEKAQAKENYEREVDQVAQSAQENSITKLEGLLKKYRGKRQEPILLAKLADLQSQDASIKFRIAHGSAHAARRGIDLSSYKKSQKATIATLTELIKKYPNFEEIAHAFFLRGRSFEELEDKPSATRDYLHLVKTYPDWEETTSAYMSLAEFSIQANDHARAIGFLDQVEKHPENPFFPFALFKLAWSHYNLKHIPTSLAYVEKHVAFYNNKNKASEKSTEALAISSDEALRENMLLDATLFYMEGYEEKLTNYDVASALDYFRKIEKGPTLGRMLVRFAKLLRSHGYEEDLTSWKNRILAQENARPESLDVLITVYENQLNKRRFKELVESAADMITLYGKHPKYEGFTRAQKLLLDTAENLQSVIVKNKAATGVHDLSVTLASIYDAFTKIVIDTDPRIPRVHYNLAETLFEIRDFERATQNYRWVVEHGVWEKSKSKEQASVFDSSLKAIGSRYEFLQSKKLIPGKIEAKSMETKPSGSPDPLLTEWIGWVDTHMEKTHEGIENFYFEANRCLYSLGYVAKAFDRLKAFAIKAPGSRFAVPSATLALDTEIVGANWERVQDLANEFSDIKWKEAEFPKRLSAVASDALYKIIENKFQTREFKAAWKRSDEFLRRYPTSKRLSDTLYLAGGSALSLNDRSAASHYYSRLISETPNADTLPAALTARAQISEDRYEFGNSAKDYRAYLERSGKKPIDNADALRRKTLMLAWLAWNPAELKQTLASKAICVEALSEDCDRYEGLALLQGMTPESVLNEDATDKAREHAKKAEPKQKAVWATLALQGAKGMSFYERLSMIRLASLHWEEADPLVRYSLIPFLSASLPAAFKANRLSMSEAAPLRANQKYIQRRIEVIKEMESGATKVMKLPWARIRATILSESADLYLDLSKGIAALPPPKDLSSSDLQAYEDTIHKLVIPFEEKGQDMRNKAFEIASRFAIEDDAFAAVAEPFFVDNPSLAKSLKPEKAFSKPLALDFKLMDRLDGKGDWDDLDVQASEPAAHLKGLWGEAILGKRWGQIGFYMQEANEKALLPPVSMSLLKTVSLAAAGARGEALSELENSLGEFQGSSKKNCAAALLSHYLSSLSREKSKDILKVILSEAERDANPEKPALTDTVAKAGSTKKTPTVRKPSAYKGDDIVGQAQNWVGG